MRNVNVSLGDRSYPILIGENILSQLGPECARRQLAKRCAIVSDRNVAKRYAKFAIRTLQAAGFDPVLITVNAGETAKNLQTVQKCYDLLAKHRLERKSFIVALGGGVVGDLAGFVAATYLRGIGFVQVPTTLLAQVDSSVGGKVGVNLKAGKNLVGAFYQPQFVLCDLSLLQTLPEREFRAGFAEVIKYGIIYDIRLFKRLELDLEKILCRKTTQLASIIARCCEIKAKIVSLDEKESDVRAILNFGHTIGHGIEAISGYGKYLHGEAISIGQIAAARLSCKILSLPPADAERITSLFRSSDLPTTIEFSPTERKRLFKAMRLDKKMSEGEIKFVLAKTIGQAVCGQKVSESLLAEVLSSLAPGMKH